MNIERRYTQGAGFTVRAGSAGGTGRTVQGYAAKFNSRSQNLGTPAAPSFEVIAPGAFDAVLKDDVVALFNHDANLILGRSRAGKGTLQIGVDTVGLWYRFEAPPTNAGDDLIVSIQRGDIDQSSFAFSVAPGGDSWGKTKEGARLRTISKIGTLFDVSPVTAPAYAETSVSVRERRNHVATVVDVQTQVRDSQWGAAVFRPTYRACDRTGP